MNWKIVLAILSCNVVFTSASYTMLIPFLPLYLVNELGVSFSEVSLWSGAIFSVRFIVGAFMAPVWGRIADRKGNWSTSWRSYERLFQYKICVCFFRIGADFK